MKMAIEEAKKAFDAGEVPVGAILVYKENIVIAKGYNQREFTQNPLFHAELIVINKGSKILKQWRLDETSLYVTLEPCPMCAGAIVQARIKKLIYGAQDLKGGGVSSLMNIPGDLRLNHQVEIVSGILEEECGSILKEFFKKLRIEKKTD